MNKRLLALTSIFMLIASFAAARWIDDKVAMPTKEVGDVIFSHYDHLEAVGRDCPTCHNDIFNIDRKKNVSFDMAAMEKGKSCGKCHNGNRAFSVTGDCATCHAGDVKIGGVQFSHSVHTDMFGCTDCHSDLFLPNSKNKTVSMAQMEKGASCGACHDGNDAFSVASDCASCHTPKDVMFRTTAAGKISFSHEVHTDMFSCADCHYDLFASGKTPPVTMAQMENGESCGACHDGGDAFSVAEDCASCHLTRDITFKTGPGGDVLFSHEVHTGMFSCNDCHTDLFPTRTGNKPVAMSQMEQGESCGACHDGGDAFSVTEDCASCHPTRDVTFTTETVGQVPFSHDVHTSMFGCGDCHYDLFSHSSGTKAVTMKQMEEGESCGACHDDGDAFSVSENCATCHPTRDIPFKSDKMPPAVFSHDIHTDMYGCTDCHTDLFKPTTGNDPFSMNEMEDGESCGACHDGGDAFAVTGDCNTCHTGN